MHAAILRYFIAVAKAESIRRASEQLHVAASAVSRQVQKLEDELGVALFERLPSGLRLTHAGTVVLKHAQSTMENFELLKSELGSLKDIKTGLIRIAALDSLFVDFLPEQIRLFHVAHPDVNFRIHGGSHSVITQLVADGDIDIGMTFNLPHPTDTKFESIIPMPLMAMVAANHPLVGHERVTLGECAKYNLLLQHDTQPIRSLIDVELSALERIGRTLIISNDIAMLKPMILAGLGVAFYSPLGMRQEIKKGNIVSIPLRETRLGGLRLGVLTSRRRQFTHANLAMIDQLKKAMRSLNASRELASK